jgi:hypothetical protein
MEVRPEKIIEAIACLKVTADHLLKQPEENAASARLAAECIKCAAALHESTQIAGLRTIHTTGSLQ